MLRKLIFFYIIIILLSCNNDSEIKEPEHQHNPIINQDSLGKDSLTIDTKKEVGDTQLLSSYTKITPKTIIKILTQKKEFDTASKFLKVYKERCNSWSLTKSDILNILYSSNEIDGQEFQYYYDILPCYYSGKINVNGKLASYIINAGSSTIIIYRDSSIYLGYKKDDYKKYFLLKPGID